MPLKETDLLLNYTLAMGYEEMSKQSKRKYENKFKMCQKIKLI